MPSVLRIKVSEVLRLEAPLHSHCKAKSKLYVRAFVNNEPQQQGPAAATTLGTTTMVERAAIEEPTDRAAKFSSTRFAIQEINKFPCVTAPLISEVPELVLEGVRFSSVVVVDLMQENRKRPLCRSLLSMQHGVLGVARQLSLSLYPVREDVSDELPAACALASLRLVVTPTDFCPEAAAVDHVTRAEEDGPRMERLRLFFAAYAPERLPWLDVVAAMAREAGWDATFRELLAANGGVEPVLQHLKVTIKQGLNMPAEGSSYVDPYVQIAILKPPPLPSSRDGAALMTFYNTKSNRKVGGLGVTHQTEVAEAVKDPMFNETFIVSLFRGSADNVWFRVWDHDLVSQDDEVGDCFFPLGLLIRGEPTTRVLHMSSKMSRFSTSRLRLEVEFTAMDFGLDPNVYGPVVEHVDKVDRRRLEHFYAHFEPSYLCRVEQQLIDYALIRKPSSHPPSIRTEDDVHDGGLSAMDTLMTSLEATYGLEPNRQHITVTIHSIQDVCLPPSSLVQGHDDYDNDTRASLHASATSRRRRPVDLSATFVNHDPEGYLTTTAGFQIKADFWGTCTPTQATTASASPSRVVFAEESNGCQIGAMIKRPATETLRLSVFLNRMHFTDIHGVGGVGGRGKHQQDPSTVSPRCDVPAGDVTIAMRSLVRGVPRKRTFPIVCQQPTNFPDVRGEQPQQQRRQPFFLNGSMTVSIVANQFGYDNAPSFQLSEVADGYYRPKLAGILYRHLNLYLPQLDSILLQNEANMDAYIDGLVEKHGPEPGRYTLTLTLTPPVDVPQSHLYRIAGESIATTCEVVPSKPHTYALDLNAATEVLTIDEVDKSNVVVRQSRFSIGWLVPGDAMANTTQTRQVTVVPNYALRKDKDTSPIVLSSMTVIIVSTTCGATIPNNNARGATTKLLSAADQIAMEDKYRLRMQQLLLARSPKDILGIDACVFMKSEEELMHYLQELVAAHGSEPGQVSISVAILSLDELLSSDGSQGKTHPRTYVKAYLNNVPIGKLLRINDLLSSSSGVGTRQRGDTSFPPADVCKVHEDILSIKVGVTGVFRNTVIGRGAMPVRFIPLGQRHPEDSATSETFDVSCWLFDDDDSRRSYVGSVTLRIGIKGFPDLSHEDVAVLNCFSSCTGEELRSGSPPRSQSLPVQGGGALLLPPSPSSPSSCSILLTSLLQKEIIAAGWARRVPTSGSSPPLLGGIVSFVEAMNAHASLPTDERRCTANQPDSDDHYVNTNNDDAQLPHHLVTATKSGAALVDIARWQSRAALQMNTASSPVLQQPLLLQQTPTIDPTMDDKTCFLFLHIVGCRDLPQMGCFGTCDTFVEAQTCYHSSIQVVGQRSNVVSGTLNPTFRFQRDDVFAVEYTNVMDQAAIALASVVPVEAVQSGAVRAVPLPMGGVVHPYLASAANRPSLTLVVKDKDMASEELIGYVDVSPALLAAGFYDVDAQELAALPAGSPAAADAWIAAHEARLLRLPIVLPGEDGAPPQHRGEILLCTTAPCLESARGTYLTPYSVYVAEGAGHVARALTTATRCLMKHKCWRELQRLHSYVAEQVLCHDAYRDRPTASIKERCDRLVEALTVEYGC